MAGENKSGSDSNCLLETAFPRTREREFHLKEVVYSQGDAADALFSVRTGTVKLAVSSRSGKRAVLRIAAAGDIFGEECLIADAVRNATAMAIEPSVIARIPRKSVMRSIRRNHAFAGLFTSHLLHRIRALEEEIMDQILDSSERRLAKTLVKIAGLDGGATQPAKIRAVDQGTLAQMIGTTRSRVSYFMNRFRRLGLIDYNGSLQVSPTMFTFLNRK